MIIENVRKNGYLEKNCYPKLPDANNNYLEKNNTLNLLENDFSNTNLYINAMYNDKNDARLYSIHKGLGKNNLPSYNNMVGIYNKDNNTLYTPFNDLNHSLIPKNVNIEVNKFGNFNDIFQLTSGNFNDNKIIRNPEYNRLMLERGNNDFSEDIGIFSEKNLDLISNYTNVPFTPKYSEINMQSPNTNYYNAIKNSPVICRKPSDLTDLHLFEDIYDKQSVSQNQFLDNISVKSNPSLFFDNLEARSQN